MNFRLIKNWPLPGIAQPSQNLDLDTWVSGPRTFIPAVMTKVELPRIFPAESGLFNCNPFV